MAVHPVHVVPLDQRSADDGVQGVEVEAVLGVALADALPEYLRAGTVVVQQQHPGPAVLRREEQVAAALDRGRGVDPHVHDVADLPVHLAGLGVERADVPRMPGDELPRTPRLDDDRLAVAGLPVGRQGPPDLLAGMLVERHHLGVGLAAHETDQPVAVDERRAGHAPRRHLGVEVGGKVPLPPHRPVRDVEGEQPAHRPEHVDPVAVDGRRGPRPDGVHQLQPRVVGLPLPRPQHLAGLLVEGEGALDHRRGPRVGAAGVGDEDPSAGHRGTGVAAVDGGAPRHREAAFGKGLDETGLVEDAPAARPPPFGPVVGVRHGTEAPGGDQQHQALRDVTRHRHSFPDGHAEYIDSGSLRLERCGILEGLPGSPWRKSRCIRAAMHAACPALFVGLRARRRSAQGGNRRPRPLVRIQVEP